MTAKEIEVIFVKEDKVQHYVNGELIHQYAWKDEIEKQSDIEFLKEIDVPDRIVIFEQN